jgi:hypothetical protein
MIKMKKGSRTKEVVDHSLVPELEKQGWDKFLDATLEVKATVKPPKKKFTEEVKLDSEGVDVTPTEKKASFNETSNKGEK